MQIAFTKMHGLGNDFLVFDATVTPILLTQTQMRWLADRHFGVGCDQLLFVENSDKPGVDFRYRIFNADGHEVQQCGNGARCFARFVRDQGLTDKEALIVETKSGLIYPRIQPDGEITVDMGPPRFTPTEIPFLATEIALQYPISVGTDIYSVGVVSMGNPHAVLLVATVDNAPVVDLGAQLTQHPCFPEGTNIGFLQIINRAHVKLRVYERGVGETLACGTGACAAMVIGQRWGYLDTAVTVELPGGRLHIAWAGSETSVLMTGAAVRVFDGVIDL
ncbi:MAG: diaminopimelate epimerase [Beggiatoa sp. IS2]|nr:MAG: diaminopimelate epimerase [Beggiatoa sp. IS2]